MIDLRYSRRDVLRSTVGLAGLTIPTFLQARAQAAAAPRARSCIIIYLWGGIGHQESWDPKPQALADLRGEFSPISTSTPGIQFCEHIPLMAKHADKLAVVRSLHHAVGGHGGALYTSMTAQRAPMGRARDRSNWPSITAMISKFREADEGTPRAICMPYLNYDNGSLIQGQFGGLAWRGLRSHHDEDACGKTIRRRFALHRQRVRSKAALKK